MTDDWLETEDAALLLGRTPRQVLRYGTSGKVRTRRQGRRYQYHRSDVEALADELEADVKTRLVSVAPEVGKALVEVVNVQRDLIAALQENRQLRETVGTLQAEVERLRDDKKRYLGIIKQLATKK